VKKIVILAVLALLALSAGQAQAAATRDKPMLKCSAYYNWKAALTNSLTHPVTKMKCANLLYSRWLDCQIKAFDRGEDGGSSLPCWKERNAMLDTIVYGKLPRLAKRNLLIDISDSLQRACEPGEVMVCGDLQKVETEIRKLER
jgi:hypothetical protein